jgi:hypothetical protein
LITVADIMLLAEKLLVCVLEPPPNRCRLRTLGEARTVAEHEGGEAQTTVVMLLRRDEPAQKHDMRMKRPSSSSQAKTGLSPLCSNSIGFFLGASSDA